VSSNVSELIVPKPTGAGVAAPVVSDAMPPPSADDTPPLPNVAGVLKLQPSEACWVEVIDARGKSLIARLVQPGEAVGLDGDLPFKVKIGNAVAMQAMFRGQPVDLGPYIRDSMAKLELK
jgi:cytoskeleton protein RodZ